MMTRTRMQLSTMWTPRSVFVIVLLCCIVIAQGAEVDSRFDSGSASLAERFQKIKESFSHPQIPDDSEKVKDAGSWAMDYLIGLIKIVGTGFAIAILTLLSGIVYGIFKLVRMCFCSKKDDDESSESEDTPNDTLMKIWLPTGLYAFFWVWLFTGCIFGIMNNPRFTDGVVDLGDYVVDIGGNTVRLGEGLINNIGTLVDSLPGAAVEIKDQMAGVPTVASNVVQLGKDVNSTSDQVAAITAKVAAINAGNNTKSVEDLNKDLADINNSSTQVISQVSDLTTEIGDNLSSSLNETLGNLDETMEDINGTVADLEDTANSIMDQATDLVDKVTKYVDDGKSYDKSRAKAVTALFSLIIVVSVTFAVGYVVRVKAIFNTVAALGWVFLFLLWFSGSIHFLLGMALSDSCPKIDIVVRGLIPGEGESAAVLTGCLYDHRTVLDSMNISSKFNLTEVFDSSKEFDSFTEFTDSFNFSSVDEYFDRIENLYSYDLRAVADNLTAESFGWDPKVIDKALEAFNEATDETTWTADNYMQADPNNYPPAEKVEQVRGLQENITKLIEANTTINQEIATAKTQLYSAQDDIDDLLADFTEFDTRYAGIKTDINTLTTTNITNAKNVIDRVETNVTDFMSSGNCSFLGETYQSVILSMCGTMQPAIDTLTVAQFLAGLALIPMVIIAEIMSFRIKKSTRLLTCVSNEVDEESGSSRKSYKGGKGDYAVAMTDTSSSVPDSPAPRHAITATIASSPQNSPDFHNSRHVIGASTEDASFE